MRSDDLEGGVVATSDPRASAAGAAVLRSGGNALDAAVAAALVLYVVEPQSCGPGGDGFLLWSAPGAPIVALDGSGNVPLGLTEDALVADGLTGVPGRGPRSVTVPGAMLLLEDAVRDLGTKDLETLAAPAVDLARTGFAVRPTLAAACERAAGEIAPDPVLGPLYAPGGRPRREGEVVVNERLAEVLQLCGSQGVRALYDGALGAAVAHRVAAAGGYLSHEDLKGQRTAHRTPASTEFRGHTVWEMPSPTQGPAVIAALSQLEPEGPRPPWDLVVEAVMSGMVSAGFDPRLLAGPPSPAKGDTTYIAVVDRFGNGASLITSVFGDFGSHFGISELGGPIGNRSAMFRALRRPVTPGERPPHTTIPAALTGPGGLTHVLGVAGGFMQAQAQVQLVIRMLDEGLAPQDAIDRPRFKILPSGDVALEAGHPLGTTRPEDLGRSPGPEGFGAAQVVGWHGGALAGGADARRGGAVATEVVSDRS